MRKRIVAPLMLLMVFSLLLVSVPPPTTAQFVLAGWDNNDGYGQGISAVYIHENSTGSWVAVKDPAFFLPSDITTYELNYTTNTSLRIWPTVNINHTLLGLTTFEEAFAIIRCGIEVTVAGGTVFSQQNMTQDGNGTQTATTWWIGYIVDINIHIVAGSIYMVVLTYEIYMEV